MKVKVLAILGVLLLLSTPIALSQDICEGDFDYDGDVDLDDLIVFVIDYGRMPGGSNPCPPDGPVCTPCEGTLSALGRWCDQGDGTVKDMTTCLVWLQKADWGGAYPLWADYGDPDAHHRAAQLWDGSPYEGTAGLSDGSSEGDWRLPTKNELVGITVGDEYIRYNQMYFFNWVQSFDYWSGTSYASSPSMAWVVSMVSAFVVPGNKNFDLYVWPVRPDN